MPLFLLALAAAAVIAALTNRRDLDAAVTGKRVVLAGPRLAGKTTLFQVLTSPDILVAEALSTQDTFDFDEASMHMKDLPWNVQCVDSPTTKGVSQQMGQELQRCDVRVFAADVTSMEDPVRRDAAEQLALTLQNLGSGKPAPWHLVLTHVDLLTDEEAATARSDAEGPAWAKLAKVLDVEQPHFCNLLHPDSRGPVIAAIIDSLQAQS